MVSKRKRQYREITFTELAKAAHSSEDAWRAVRRYNELREAGKAPRIYYSQHNGYRVRDPLDYPFSPY